MKLGLYCSPLGGVTPPFGHSRKEIGTLMALGTLAVGVGSVIAGASAQSSANEANKQMTEDTNKTNLQIARETNEMSQAQFNSNMQWSKEQFGLQRQYALEDREYNSIQNQVNRALAAGINPSAVIGNGSAAHSTTPVGSVSLPSQSNFQTGYAQAGHVDPVNYDFSGISESIGHTVDAFNQSRMISANVENTNADTQIKRADAMTRLSENLARVRKLYTENEALLQSNKLNEATRNKIQAEQKSIEQQMSYFESVKDDMAKGVRLTNTRVERETKHLDFEENMRMAELAIQKKLADSGINLNSANAALALSQASESEQRKAGIKDVQDFNRKVEAFRIAKERYETEAAKFSSVDAFLNSGSGHRSIQQYREAVKDLDDIMNGLGLEHTKEGFKFKPKFVLK